MDTFVSYLIRSLLISGLMLGYYLAVLRNRKFHSFNRAWLLTSLLASVVLPLIRVGWLTWRPAAQSRAILAVGTTRVAMKTFPIGTIVLLAGAVISAALLSILVIRVRRVYRLKRGHRIQRLEGCMLIEVQDRRAPFSFLKNLFWQEGADIREPVHRKILDHELAHIRGGHTYDTLFAQTVAAVLWINPFLWLIRRELQMVHEFIADDASIAQGDTETFARMLLSTYNNGRYLDPSHSFYFSPIKRRLRMINSSKRPSRWRLALALPALLTVMALACSKESNAPAQLTKPLTVNFLKQPNIFRDSFHVTFGSPFKKLILTGTANKNQFTHIIYDKLGSKAKLDLHQTDEVSLLGVLTDDKVPPPPPPKVKPSSN